MSSIYSIIYDELKVLKEYRQYAPVFDALDREQVGDIILDGNIFWIEHQSYSDMTDQTYAKLINYIEKHKGYKYLYHTKEYAK